MANYLPFSLACAVMHTLSSHCHRVLVCESCATVTLVIILIPTQRPNSSAVKNRRQTELHELPYLIHHSYWWWWYTACKRYTADWKLCGTGIMGSSVIIMKLADCASSFVSSSCLGFSEAQSLVWPDRVWVLIEQDSYPFLKVVGLELFEVYQKLFFCRFDFYYSYLNCMANSGTEFLKKLFLWNHRISWSMCSSIHIRLLYSRQAMWEIFDDHLPLQIISVQFSHCA